jgi:hypothetical protein
MMDNEKQSKQYNKTKIFLVSLFISIVILLSVAYLLQHYGKSTIESTNTSNDKPLIEQQEQKIASTSNAPKVLNAKDCGDGKCSITETYSNCKSDCIETCGDGIAQPDENLKNCRHDLMYNCGNGICDEWEHYRYCSQDCSECVVDDDNKYSGENKCPPSPRWVQ